MAICVNFIKYGNICIIHNLPSTIKVRNVIILQQSPYTVLRPTCLAYSIQVSNLKISRSNFIPKTHLPLGKSFLVNCTSRFITLYSSSWVWSSYFVIYVFYISKSCHTRLVLTTLSTPSYENYLPRVLIVNQLSVIPAYM